MLAISNTNAAESILKYLYLHNLTRRNARALS
jgi:hypothetical protein